MISASHRDIFNKTFRNFVPPGTSAATSATTSATTGRYKLLPPATPQVRQLLPPAPSHPFFPQINAPGNKVIDKQYITTPSIPCRQNRSHRRRETLPRRRRNR